MDNTLCTSDDFKQEAVLRKAFEQALAAREDAQTELDILQGQYEDARLRLYTAEALCINTPNARLQELKADCETRQNERDQETARLDAALSKAREALSTHLNRFGSAAGGWLGTFERNYPFDEKLVQLAGTARQQIQKMVSKLEPLSAISETYEEVRGKIESWQLAPCPAPGLGGIHYRIALEIPRLQDLLR